MSLYSLRTNYFLPYKQTYRDGWEYFFSKISLGECVAASPKPWSINPPWSWYVYTDTAQSPKTINIPAELDGSGCDVVWFLRDRNVFVDVMNIGTDDVQERLKKDDYTLVDSHLFSAIEIARYRRRPQANSLERSAR